MHMQSTMGQNNWRTSTRTDRGNDSNFVAFLDHKLVWVFGVLRHVDIVQVDSHEGGVQDLDRDAGVSRFQCFKKFTDGQWRWDRLEFLGREGAGTCKVEHVEVPRGRLGDHVRRSMQCGTYQSNVSSWLRQRSVEKIE